MSSWPMPITSRTYGDKVRLTGASAVSSVGRAADF
jgi:hypothetical protein